MAVLKTWKVGELAELAEGERGRQLHADLSNGTRSWRSLSKDEKRSAGGVALIDLVRERSLGVRFEDPSEMLDLASTGCFLADHLAFDPQRGEPPWVRDLQARAWAELGNAFRVADELDKAESALSRARELALQGTRPPKLITRLTELLASLFIDRRRFAEALRMLEGLEIYYQNRQDRSGLAGVLLMIGRLHGQELEPERAILAFLRSCQLIQPEEPLRLAAVHGLAVNLIEAQHLDEAKRLVDANRRLYRKSGKLNRIRLVWLEGKVALGLGDLGMAEAKLNTARLAFVREGQSFDASLVGLNLALLLARQERRRELRLLAEQLLKTFRSLGIAQEAIASLVLLRQSCQEGRSVDYLCGQIEMLARWVPQLRRSRA